MKPQFEVGPERVGKGGIVRDPVHRRQALEDIRDFVASLGVVDVVSTDSPITGAKGNHEFLLAFLYRPPDS